MSPGPTEIRVGLATCSVASGALHVKEALDRELESRPDVVVKTVGCRGLCSHEPLVEVVSPGGERAIFGNVDAALARRIAKRAASRGWLDRLLGGLTDVAGRLWAGEAWPEPDDHLLLSAARPRVDEVRIVLENCGRIDPVDVDESAAHGGWEALRRAVLELTPDEVIARVDRSGLRGRGGAGFPTGRKWRLARSAPATQRVVVCNADEGDPGAFMDRLVLESDPQRVLEGLAIAAYAVGASRAVVFVRAEYPVALARSREAAAAARSCGYLGERVLGTDFSVEVEVFESPGAFVCGEETALIAQLEGRRSVPRFRPPYPVQSGVSGYPTVVNNVETLACVPWIVRHGPEEFAKLGTTTSRGTKVFALAGKVRRGGLIEVPMGTTIRAIVQEVGGGVARGRALKAVQIGGPSGGCVPASLADTPIDYEALRGAGAMMGSGGLVVLDETDCMVDVARFFLAFTRAESCGKCPHCRIGVARMLEILDRLTAGHGTRGDLDTLEALARTTSAASLCGLGKTAPNPVTTTLGHFRGEYEAHLDGRCPAGRCAALVTYQVTEPCIGCTLCAQVCPVGAVAARPYERHLIDETRCLRCGGCRTACPVGAIRAVTRARDREGI